MARALPHSYQQAQQSLSNPIGSLDSSDLERWGENYPSKRLKSFGRLCGTDDMAGDAYPDSSFLVSLFRADANHLPAARYLTKVQATLTFTPLHRIEVRNALRNACALGQIKENELRVSFQEIERDLREGLLVHTAVEWTRVFRRADDLSAAHSSAKGQRTIDLLHVALALESGAKDFLSFDSRQRVLAKAARLRAKP
jgi:predicted nucleic acid-binding protein